MSKVLFNTYCCVLLVLQITKAVSGKLIYVPSFTAIKTCENFKNEYLNLDKIEFTIEESSEGEEKGVGLSGPMEIFKPITEEHEISLGVVKCTEVGKEPMFSALSSICESMKKDDAPWSALFKMMNITGCPINAESYPLEDFKISLSSFDNVLNRDFCGEYEVSVEVMKGRDTESCHIIGIEIIEIEIDD